MSFFSAAELAELQEVQVSTFADLCSVIAPVESSDGSSGFTHAWTLETTVMCAVSSPSQAAQTGLPIMDYGGDERQMIFSLPVGTDVQQGYRIEWFSRTFEVERVEEPGTYPMQITAIGLERIP